MGAVTEKEAFMRMCPMLIAADREHRECIGSHCMAWRWDRTGDYYHVDKGTGERVSANGVPTGSYDRIYETGFCGLGGNVTG